MKFIISKCALVFTLLLYFSNVSFAQNESDKGIELYKQGKNKEAVAALEKASRKAKSDADTWNYLGLAHTKDESYKKAVKAFEKAVAVNARNATYQTNLAYAYFLTNKLDKAQKASTKAIELDSQIASAYYIRGTASVWEGDNDDAVKDAEQAISLNAGYAAAYNLKADALLANFGRRVGGGAKPIDHISLLEQAQQTLEICLKKCQNNALAEAQEKRLDAVQAFYKHFSKNKDAQLGQISDVEPPDQTAALSTLPDPNNAPLKISNKPKPIYTNKARQNGVVGTVKLAVLFAESGRVTHMLILKGLGGGLTENAMNAARQIQFEPAKKDGKAISQVRILEYSFSIY